MSKLISRSIDLAFILMIVYAFYTMFQHNATADNVNALTAEIRAKIQEQQCK